MSPIEYEPFAKQIADAGLFTNGIHDCGTWSRTCVASKRRQDGGYTGNSFWVTVINGDWYFGTWGGWYYRLTDPARAPGFCIAWLTHRPSPTLSSFDKDFIERFGLVPISDDVALGEICIAHEELIDSPRRDLIAALGLKLVSSN